MDPKSPPFLLRNRPPAVAFGTLLFIIACSVPAQDWQLQLDTNPDIISGAPHFDASTCVLTVGSADGNQQCVAPKSLQKSRSPCNLRLQLDDFLYVIDTDIAFVKVGAEINPVAEIGARAITNCHFDGPAPAYNNEQLLLHMGGLEIPVQEETVVIRLEESGPMVVLHTVERGGILCDGAMPVVAFATGFEEE